MRYAVVFTKGGVGKTSFATHLATWFQRQGKDTLLIDGDPQPSSVKWAGRRQDLEPELIKRRNITSPVTVSLTGKAIYDEGVRLSEGFEETVIDTGGRSAAGVRNALLMADCVLVPVPPYAVDYDELEEIKELLELIQDLNRDLKCLVVPYRALVKEDIPPLKEHAEALGFTVAKSWVPDRKVFKHAQGVGMTLFDYKPVPADVLHLLKTAMNEIEDWSHED